MDIRHIAVTQDQFDETWNSLPPEMRFWDDNPLRKREGTRGFLLGNLFVWLDYVMPENQRSDEVVAELKRVLEESKYSKNWRSQ